MSSEIITIIVTGVVSTVTALVTWYVKDKATNNNLEKQALVILLRREYIRVYDSDVNLYKNARHKLDELNDIYDVYQKLGGNSTVTELHKQACNILNKEK